MLSLPSPAPTYAANGNQKNLTATGESISWNAQNQPISMNGVTATYDALGRMVETGSGGSYQQFVFTPDGNPYAIYNAGTSTLIKGTVPLPGGDTAIYNQSGLSYLRHTDWLGSSRLATTWAHAVYSKEAYAPFGETYNEAGTADRSFTGDDQDVVSGSGGTGAYDFLFRKQDPSAGRWLSPDPFGWGAVDQTNPQTLNRYAYALNNPLTLIDPNGLDVICVGFELEGGYYQFCYDDSPTTITVAPDDGPDPNPEQDPSDCLTWGNCFQSALSQSFSFFGQNSGANSSAAKACSSAPLSGNATYYNNVGRQTASQTPFNPASMNAAMFQPGVIQLGQTVTVSLQSNPSQSVNVVVNDTGPFAVGSNGRVIRPLAPNPNNIIDLTPAAFIKLAGSLAAGKVPVTVTPHCPR